jgi:hypothetical protein
MTNRVLIAGGPGGSGRESAAKGKTKARPLYRLRRPCASGPLLGDQLRNDPRQPPSGPGPGRDAPHREPGTAELTLLELLVCPDRAELRDSGLGPFVQSRQRSDQAGRASDAAHRPQSALRLPGARPLDRESDMTRSCPARVHIGCRLPARIRTKGGVVAAERRRQKPAKESSSSLIVFSLI